LGGASASALRLEAIFLEPGFSPNACSTFDASNTDASNTVEERRFSAA
jgi:hypothetical protein